MPTENPFRGPETGLRGLEKHRCRSQKPCTSPDSHAPRPTSDPCASSWLIRRPVGFSYSFCREARAEEESWRNVANRRSALLPGRLPGQGYSGGLLAACLGGDPNPPLSFCARSHVPLCPLMSHRARSHLGHEGTWRDMKGHEGTMVRSECQLPKLNVLGSSPPCPNPQPSRKNCLHVDASPAQ